jgi:Tol biopolymer transport system component
MGGPRNERGTVRSAIPSNRHHRSRSKLALAAAACVLGGVALGAPAEGALKSRRPVPADTARLFVLPLQGSAPQELDGVGRFTFLSSPHYSHDDGSVAFTAQRCSRCRHLLALATAGTVRLLSKTALRVVWYPRSPRLLFVHVSRHGTTLYSIGADSRGFRRVAAERDSDGVSSFDTPAVAPDGRTIAYSREIEPVESRELFVRDLRTGRTRVITPLPLWSIEPEFSPDGRRIAFACQLRSQTFGICIADRDGKRRQVLTRGPEDHDPTFSPDGKTIVFASARGAAAFGIRSLWSIGADGRGLRRLTRGADDAEASFSHDGTRLVFVRRKVRYVQVAGG